MWAPYGCQFLLQWIMADSNDRLILPFRCLHIYDLMLLSSSWIPNQIRPLSNICQLDVSAAFSAEASTLYHIMWREEPFSHFICLINPPPPFFLPSDCEDFDTRASGESRRFLSNYSKCNRRKKKSLTSDVTESQQCERSWRMQQFEVQLIVKSV